MNRRQFRGPGPDGGKALTAAQSELVTALLDGESRSMTWLCETTGRPRASVRFSATALYRRGIIDKEGRPQVWTLAQYVAEVIEEEASRGKLQPPATIRRDGRICGMLARTSTPCGARTIARELQLPPEQTARDLQRLAHHGHIIARPYTGGVLYGASRVLLDREKKSRARR